MDESQIATITPARFAATDMLHRRILLPYKSQLLPRTSNVLIKADSHLMKMAIGSLARSPALVGEVFAGVWEVAVEVRSDTASLLDWEATNSFDEYWIGPSRSFRMSSGSWFAYTPPSLSGVGFAMIAGDESCQIRQLATYIENIKLFLEYDEARSGSQMKREVPA